MLPLIVLLLGVVAGELAWLSLNTKKSLVLLEGIQRSLTGDRHAGDPVLTNYTTWTFVGDKWSLVENRCDSGYEAGSPPGRAGYPDETVCMPCVRKC